MSDEERLADLLLFWEAMFKRGVDVRCDLLCKDTPDLMKPLAERVALLKRMNWLDPNARDQFAPSCNRGGTPGDAFNEQAASDSRLADDLLLRWEELYEQGQDVAAKELCRESPELTSLLEERIKTLKAVAWIGTSACRIRIRGVNGDVDGKIWESDRLIRAGRLATLEIVLNDGSVSWRHAAIGPTPIGWSVRDLGSKNGTFVNETKIGDGKFLLKQHDIVRFGNVAFVIDRLKPGVCEAGKTLPHLPHLETSDDKDDGWLMWGGTAAHNGITEGPIV
jgi:FHA domain